MNYIKKHMVNTVIIMIVIIAALFFYALVFEFGSSNKYYDRMNDMEEKIRQEPENINNWKKLYKYIDHWDYWNRFYALGTLHTLTKDNIGDRQKAIHIFKKSIRDDDQAIQRESVLSIMAIGSDAIDICIPELVEAVKSRRETDVAWFSAEALGQISKKEDVNEIFNLLIKIAGSPPPTDTPIEAPQLRIECLLAAKNLAIRFNKKEEALTEFNKLLKSDDTEYHQVVLKAIKGLKEADVSDTNYQ